MTEQPELPLKHFNAREEIDKLSRVFGFKVPVDGLMTAIMGKHRIDIIALDKALISKYGDYEGSMNNFIREKFGAEYAEMLDILNK